MHRLTGLLRIDQQIAVMGADPDVLRPVMDLNKLGFGISLQLFCHGMHQRHELC